MSFDEDRTAYDHNIEEVIYNLWLEPDATEILQMNLELSRHEMKCRDCGEYADWWVSEIRTKEGYEAGDGGRVNSFFCDSCIPEPFVQLWCYWPWTDEEALDHDDAGVDIEEGDGEGSPDVLTDGGQFPSEERMEWFYREIEAFTDHKVQPHESEVTMSIVEPEDTFTIDLEPVVDAGLSYRLVLSDGLVGNHTGELHFQPQETIDPAYHEIQDEPSGESLLYIPPEVSEQTYHAIIRVWRRWGVSIFEAEKFLEEVGFFDSESDERGPV
ncbi:MAG: hypothetical protein ACQETI_01180 [Halobacteriota archaeon]